MGDPSTRSISEDDIDKVHAAADYVQALAPLPRALLSREALVRTAGGTLDIGPAEARLRRILRLTGRCGMVLISLALLARRFLAGRRIGEARCIPISVFVGIDAMRETKLLEDISTRFNLKPSFVDQRTPKGFSALPSPSFRRVTLHWLRLMRECMSLLKNPNPHFKRLDIISTLAMRCHELSYLLAVFEATKQEQSGLEIFFSNHDLPAHAACLVGLKANFYQHGFLNPASIFPDFTRMFALTQYEARHVGRGVPKLQTQVITSRQEQSETLLRTIAVTGIYGDADPHTVTMLALLAKDQGYKLVVRPHPRGTDAVWSGLNILSNVKFDTEGSFEEFFGKWRPSFIATWYSTTLLDGLIMGSVPITFSTGQEKLVLPLRKIALAFPNERNLLENCLSDKSVRNQVYKKLRLEMLQ